MKVDEQQGGMTAGGRDAWLHHSARIASHARHAAVQLNGLLTPNPGADFTEERVSRVRAMIASLGHQTANRIARQLGTDAKAVASLTQDMQLPSTPELATYAYARVVDSQLTNSAVRDQGLVAERPPIIQACFEDKNGRTASLAMGFLVAQNRFLTGAERSNLHIDDLPAELFHDLCQMVAGAFRVRADHSATAVLEAVQAILAQHDEENARHVVIAQLIDRPKLASGILSQDDPVFHAGPTLFLASVGRQIGVSLESMLWIAAEPGQDRLALALTAAEIPRNAVRSALAALMLSPFDPGPAFGYVASISAYQAREAIAQWSLDQFLPEGGK